MNGREIAPIAGGDWKTMIEQATVLVKSGFLPAHIKTPEQAVAVMLTGRELGIPTMTALRTIAVIQGKPTLAAELMAALIERDYGPLALRVEETNDSGCVVSYWKPGWPDRKSYAFTIDQARAAGLAGSDVWKKYPAALLRARCISAVAKMAFQATLGGLYLPEELGAEVTVTDDGEVVYAPESVPTAIDAAHHERLAQTLEIAPQKPRTLNRDEAVTLRQIARDNGYSTEDILAWLAHHGFSGMGAMTERDADLLRRHSINKLRPWEETQAESLSDDDRAELATVDLGDLDSGMEA
jgi:hypothetical protein